MPIKRHTMTFWLPTSLADVLTAPGLQSTGDRVSRKLYINPQSVNIREQKLVSEQVTKGGYMVQYWGEQLPSIQAQGTTGSSGIEGINILREIYRHEQAAMRAILLQREDTLASQARISAREKGTAEEDKYADGGWGYGEALLDVATGGAYSSIKSGVSNSIDILSDAYSGSYLGLDNKEFTAPANLASFATTIDLSFQGEVFRGFFTDFSYSEDANSPGLFTYTFNFKVTKRVGERKNFMPWHKNPLAADGETRQSATPPERSGGNQWENMSFFYGPTRVVGNTATTVSETQSTPGVDVNVAEQAMVDEEGFQNANTILSPRVG